MMTLETARAILKAPNALRYDIIAAADHMIQHGDATDKTFALTVKAATGCARVTHYRAPRSADLPFISPQAEINAEQLARDYRATGIRYFRAGLLWVAAAVVLVIGITAGMAAPGKLRADLRMIQQFEEQVQ